MRYTDEQKMQIDANIQKIVDYITTNVLPHITYMYETGPIGPDYYIELNGPYSDQIRFRCGYNCYNAHILANEFPEDAVIFLKHWQDAKCYMNTEIKNNAETIKLIETFEV